MKDEERLDRERCTWREREDIYHKAEACLAEEERDARKTALKTTISVTLWLNLMLNLTAQTQRIS